MVPRARSAQFPSRHPSYTQLQAVHCCISIRRHIRSPTLAASFVASLPQNGGILTRSEKGKKKVNKTWRAHSCGSVPTQVCHSLCMLCGSRRGRCDVVLQQYTAFFSADPRNDTATHERASPHDKTLVSVPDHVLDERGSHTMCVTHLQTIRERRFHQKAFGCCSASQRVSSNRYLQ